jgi:hypothetical protein
VEQAFDRTQAQWAEVKKLGGFMNREWLKIWRARKQGQEAAAAVRSSADGMSEEEIAAAVRNSMQTQHLDTQNYAPTS